MLYAKFLLYNLQPNMVQFLTTCRLGYVLQVLFIIFPASNYTQIIPDNKFSHSDDAGYWLKTLTYI